MRFPLNTIFQIDDLFMLRTCYESEHNYPLITSFVIHNSASFRLRIVMTVRYDAGQLIFLSEPNDASQSPVVETLDIPLISTGAFQYRVLVLRDDFRNNCWEFTRLQFTLLSPTIILTEFECRLDDGLDSGIFCQGPSDPWDPIASANTDPVIYWLPISVFESAPFEARQSLRAQVSTCPLWTFSMPTHVVRYVVHCLV